MYKLALAFSLAAHACAWIAFLFLLFWTGFYSGQSEIARAVNTPSDQSQAPLTRVETEVQTESFSASIVEINGKGVIPIMAIPVLLTAAAVVGVLLLDSRPRFGISLMWTSTIATVMFCLLGAFSIGLFYFPAALALILASTIESYSQLTKGPDATPA